MKQFDTVNELAKAYRKQFNAAYANDPQKSFSVKDVYNYCIELTPSVTMSYKYGINSFAYTVKGFGYVLTSDRLKRAI